MRFLHLKGDDRARAGPISPYRLRHRQEHQKVTVLPPLSPALPHEGGREAVETSG